MNAFGQLFLDLGSFGCGLLLSNGSLQMYMCLSYYRGFGGVGHNRRCNHGAHGSRRLACTPNLLRAMSEYNLDIRYGIETFIEFLKELTQCSCIILVHIVY